MNLQIIIDVVVEIPLFLAGFVGVSGMGQWDLIPSPGWESMH